MEVYRNAFPIRLWHWTFAVAASGLLFTGICILDIHPRLYWGEVGNEFLSAWVAVDAAGTPTAGQAAPAVLKLGSHRVNVTGILGVPLDAGADGYYFLAFAMPDSWHFGGLRAWHFALAWVLVLGWITYAIFLALNRQAAARLVPAADQLTTAAIVRDVVDHLRLRRPSGPDATRYGSLQKLAYLGVVGLLVPLLTLTGLAMSNAITIRFPGLLDVLGGRESARTLHALSAFTFALFVLIHFAQLLVIGPINALRAMTTGYYRLEGPRS